MRKIYILLLACASVFLLSTEILACEGTLISAEQQALLSEGQKTSPQKSIGKDGPTLVIFYDYLCGYCKRSDIELEKYLTSHNKSLNVVYRPLGKLGPVSDKVSRAALAAASQNKFFEYHYILMHTRATPSDDFLLETARKIGLNVEKFQKDMSSPEVTKILETNLKLSKDLGFRTVPSFFLENCHIPHSLTEDGFEAEINDIQMHMKKK